MGVELNKIIKAFTLEEGQVVPPEFKEGDEVELHLHGDATAEIWGIEHSRGYYLFKHIASGKEFKTWHRAEAYRFDPLPTPQDDAKKLGQRKPLVITGPEVAGILERFSAGFLRKLPENDEAFLVKHDVNNPGISPPSLSIVITFDPTTYKAKTITVANTKTVVKTWNADADG